MYLEKISQLLERAPRDAEDIAAYADVMVDYVHAVVRHVIQSRNASLRLDGEELMFKLETLNQARNEAHDNACVACENINKIAARNHLPKVFDFELEPMEKNGVFAGYSQNNHYAVSLFCGQFVNEFYKEGTLEYNNHILDKVAREDESYNRGELQNISEKSAEWTKHLEESKIAFKEQEYPVDLKLRDGVIIHVEEKVDDYAYNISIEGEGSVAELTGDNKFYFPKGKCAIEIPPAAIQDIVDRHGGLAPERDSREVEKER